MRMASKERKACQEAGEASTSRTPRLFAPPPKLRNGKSISSLPSRTSRDPNPQILRSLLIRCSKLPQGKSRSFPLSSRPHQSLIGSKGTSPLAISTIFSRTLTKKARSADNGRDENGGLWEQDEKDTRGAASAGFRRRTDGSSSPRGKWSGGPRTPKSCGRSSAASSAARHMKVSSGNSPPLTAARPATCCATPSQCVSGRGRSPAESPSAWTIESAAWTDRLITVSVGVAMLGPALSGPADLLNVADRALYHSKREDRNRVTAAN